MSTEDDKFMTILNIFLRRDRRKWYWSSKARRILFSICYVGRR